MNKRRRYKAKRRRAQPRRLKAGDVFTISGRNVVNPPSALSRATGYWLDADKTMLHVNETWGMEPGAVIAVDGELFTVTEH